MLRKMRLQNKIIVMFAIVISLTMSGILIFDTYSLRNAVEETYVRQLRGITVAINGRYEEQHSVQDVQQIFDYIRHKDPTVLDLTLNVKRGNQYTVLASTDRQKIGNSSATENQRYLEMDRTIVTHIHDDPDNIPKVRLTTPLKEDGITIGSIELLLDTSEENTAILDEIRRTLFVGGIITLFLLALLWIIIRKMLVVPLLALREAAVSVQQGSAYQEVKLKASPEINQVVAAFNDMVYNLEDRYQKSITDCLTGTYNSAYFKHELEKSINQARIFNHPLALLFCDVDNFKSLNDNEGHLYGDRVLAEIANVLKEHVRPTDIVCRYGGEEFAVIMPYADRETALETAERIRQMVIIQCSHSQLTPITISIGVAMYPDEADEESLVHLADEAMYTAKSLGKNRVISVSEMENYKQQGYRKRTEDSKWLLNTIVSLARAVEVKDRYTHSHSEMVSRYASAIAGTMGLPDEVVRHISIAGLLHDIGKIGIPDSILNKEERLTPDEYELMKGHPVIGYNILSSVEELNDVLPYVLYHHERPDGKGYPKGLKAEEIPLGASIIAVADAYHSMVSARPYRKNPLTTVLATLELKKGAGTQFHPDVVDAFLSIIHDMKEI